MGDEQVSVLMSPEKTAGQGFGSPGTGDDSAPGAVVQNADLYIKYDPRTGNGYSLRWWRTTQSATAVAFQLYKHVNGVGSPIDSSQVLTGVFKPNTTVTLSIIGNVFSASAYNNVDSSTLFLQSIVAPNNYGGAGTRWSGSVPAGNSNAYSFFSITKPMLQLATSVKLGKTVDGYQAIVTVTNIGVGTAPDVQLNAAIMGSAAGVIGSPSLGDIAAGTSATTTVNFPSSVGKSGSGTVEKLAGTYAGGVFGSTLRISLP